MALWAGSGVGCLSWRGFWGCTTTQLQGSSRPADCPNNTLGRGCWGTQIYTPRGWEGRRGHSIQPLPPYSGPVSSHPAARFLFSAWMTPVPGSSPLGEGY